MFHLDTWVEPSGELTAKGRRLTKGLVILYSLALILICWTPQYGMVEGVQTPDIQYFGRVVVLLTPFNSFTNFDQLDSLKEIIFVVGQNITNIFLLTPLILVLLALFPSFRAWKKVVLASFALSLTIELGQVVLDFLIDANRVFEIDDLWTNTLGGLVALGIYRFLVTWITRYYSKTNKV